MAIQSVSLIMISPFLDLETRRKILFVDDHFTIRSLGTDGVLITIASRTTPQHSIENAQRFLACRSELNSISRLILDISQARDLSVHQMLAFSKIRSGGLQRFAVSSKWITHRLLFPFFKPFFQSVQFKLFNDVTTAIEWTRAE